MTQKSLILTILPDPYAVCRLAPGAQPPEWNKHTEFFSITHSKDTITMVCLSKYVPEEVDVQRDWRVLQIIGPMDPGLSAMLAAAAAVLTDSGISNFAISTFDTDFLLVREDALAKAVDVLKSAGHRFFGDP